MDSMGHALKNKMKGAKIAPLDMQAEMEHEKDMDPKELMAHEKGESPAKEKQEKDSGMDKESDDLAPEVKDGDAQVVDEHTMLKHMSGNGNLGRSPMSLGEKAKGKMKERMAAIEKSKKGY